MLTHPEETRGQVGLTFLSLRVLRDALGKGSGGCELQVGLSSTSLLASAKLVSHEMQWHQIFNEHVAKKEEWCPPGQRAGTLKWSSAAHKCRKKQTKTTVKNWILSTAGGANCQLTFIFLPPYKKQKVHPCALWQRQ